MLVLPQIKYQGIFGCILAKRDRCHDSLVPKFVLGRRVSKTHLAKTRSAVFVFLVLRFTYHLFHQSGFCMWFDPDGVRTVSQVLPPCPSGSSHHARTEMSGGFVSGPSLTSGATGASASCHCELSRTASL